MKPRRTHYSDRVYSLPGGTEDDDLWVIGDTDDAMRPVMCSVWELSDDERARIAAGENVAITLWGEDHPPIQVDVVDYPLGAPPRE